MDFTKWKETTPWPGVPSGKLVEASLRAFGLAWRLLAHTVYEEWVSGRLANQYIRVITVSLP